MAQARSEVQKIGFPLLGSSQLRLRGRAMEICYDNAQFERYVAEAFVVAQGQPVLIDRFWRMPPRWMSTPYLTEPMSSSWNHGHIEEAGVHSVTRRA